MCKHTRARGETPKPRLRHSIRPRHLRSQAGSAVFNCIHEQEGMQTPRRPLMRGRRARPEAPAKPAPSGRTRGPAEADRIEAGTGSPGTRLGRPFGPGFALRPGLIGRKDHGRRRAQAARQSRTANMGRCPLNKTQAQAPSSPSSPCSPQAAVRGSGRLRAGSCRDSPALNRRGPVPAKMRGIFTGPAPAY